MLRNTITASALALSTLFAVGCTEQVEEGFQSYDTFTEYTDGAQARTSNGAFKVTLFSEDGQAVTGENKFYVRVAMPNPADELDEGKGIPGADISYDVFCDTELRGGVDSTITYEDDGVYAIDPVFLGAGTCELALDIAVGQTIREEVSFFFTIEQ
jgi:hypothetical protein